MCVVLAPCIHMQSLLDHSAHGPVVEDTICVSDVAKHNLAHKHTNEQDRYTCISHVQVSLCSEFRANMPKTP